MDIFYNAELLSRVQFGFIALFHILWPPLTIGLALILLALEVTWVNTSKVYYYHLERFLTKIFLVNFGVGVISGLPMEFSFGTNWGGFSIASGDFFGNILGFETAMAFMLEAGFLGIMLFGWKRVGPKMHLFATAMVTFGSVLSAFWIMVANSWMQTPTGVTFQHGKFIINSYMDAIFNPDFIYGFGHMFTACLELSLVVTAGVSAYYLLHNRHTELFTSAFKWSVLTLLLVAPLQILIGDAAGGALEETQPAKLAAIEALWDTNKPGTGAPWSIVAAPNATLQKNDWEISVPYGASLIVTKSLTGTVRGLKDFVVADQPPIWMPFYGFRLMVAAGVFIAFMTLLTTWKLLRHRDSMRCDFIGQHRWMLRGWLLSIPAAYLAIEAGWIVREVGRQPWIVYGMMRTASGVSALPLSVVRWSLLTYVLLYSTIGISALVFMLKVLRKGPSFDSPPKKPTPRAVDNELSLTTGGRH